jgi:hypothetical protein
MNNAAETATRDGGIDCQEGVRPPCWWQVGLGLAVLGLGVLVYIIDRPPGLTALPESLTLFQPTVTFFGALGQSLPAFAHVFAFSLLTAALLGGGRRTAMTICTSWFLVDAAFELGQHPTIATKLASLTPSWFEAIPILHRTNDFFLSGTFDAFDLLAMALGALAAYAVMQRTQLRRTNHD